MNGISRLPRVPALSLRLLGEFQLLRDDVPVAGLEGARLQSLLTYLVLHHDVPQSRTRLACLRWPAPSRQSSMWTRRLRASP
jgi:DNA-binding SARP family transcriptional activator